MERQRTKVDNLAFSLSRGEEQVPGFLAGLFRHIGKPALEVKHGRHGFQARADISIGGASIGWWGWGGAAQRGRSYVEISGTGCALVDDWKVAQRSISCLPDVRAKRIDIAADFYRGEVTLSDVLSAYRGGKFARTGRPPKLTRVLNEDPAAGDTVYIGARGNDVFFRAYEKGKQVFAGLPAAVRAHGASVVRGQDDDGNPFALGDWTRLELELRSSKRELPLDVITQRDQYFAGAYPYLHEVLPDVVPEILVRPEHVAEADLARSLQLIRAQWGTTLFTALTVYQGDVFDVWRRIVGQEHNSRLVAGGAVLFGDRFIIETEEQDA